jgi:NPCBM-associated, NEW3 domain of alpha-galactosidase/Alpha-L-fucosidase/F5/8 type C domain
MIRGRRAIVAALAAIVLGMTAAQTAQAELLHPRQEWMRNSTAGLFLHWGMFTSPMQSGVTDYKTYCANWEKAVTDGGWDPRYWVREAQKLHASYLVLTTFHSRLGYARPWPSKIPGSCATQRDFLGETIAAAKAEGLKVILYMTDDPQWHNEQRFESLDSAAYSAYKGKQVDLTTRDGFGEYSYDLFFEVMDRYPDLAGFWIDNDNAYWERNHLYEQIREKRPTWLLSNNNEDTPIMDTVSNEQKTGMTPDYDYPQAVTVPQPRLTEADYKLPTSGQWWWDGNDSVVDYDLSIGRYITNAGSSIKSLMAETAQINGRFPPRQEAFNNFMADYLPPIWKSIGGTEGGGYMYGGMQPGAFNDGAHGVITVDKHDPDTQYVHVTTKPRFEDMVRVRDNGYKVTSVSDVRTGAPLRFNQSGGYLTILGVEDWDAYDTVFQVTTDGRQGVYPQNTIKATASASADGFPASNLTDGSYLNYWDADRKVPATIDLDLGAPKPASYLAINQREWSPTYNRETFGRAEDSSRIKDYRVYVSSDGRSWGKPVKTGTMPSARGVQFIDIGPQRSRYIRLEILNTWGTPHVPAYYNKLAIDELYVGHTYPFSAENPLPGEAENGTTSGGAKAVRCDACSNAGQVSLGAGAVTLDGVNAAEAGDHRLAIHFTAAGAGALHVSVNGAAPIDVPVAGESRDLPVRTAISAPLKAGANTVRITGTGAVGVDRIAVTQLPPESYVPRTRIGVEPLTAEVKPGGTFKVSAELRLDDIDPVDDVSLAPQLPAGWTMEPGPATAKRLESGQTLTGSWTVTVPADATPGMRKLPVRASFTAFGRPEQSSGGNQVDVIPLGLVSEIEAESSSNTFSGQAAPTGCFLCSGGTKVRFIGSLPANHLTVNGITVPTAGQYDLYLDYLVSGTRTFYISVNGGAPIQARLSGTSSNDPVTARIPVTLSAGANSIRFYNDTAGAPDLDRVRVAVPG